MSARGKFSSPTLFRVDLTSQKIERFVLPREPDIQIPLDKAGTMGLARIGDSLAVAVWSAIHLLDANLRVQRSIVHPLFSDLHGLAADGDSVLVASTNADAILRWDLEEEVILRWSRRHGRPDAGKILARNGSLRDKTKDDVGSLYRWHVNDVMPLMGDAFLVSFLGQQQSRPVRGVQRRVGRRVLRRRGGIARVDAKGRSRVIYRGEGLHDLCPTTVGVVSTSYFGRSLVVVDPESLRTRSISLADSVLSAETALTRGVCQHDEESVWVGRTVARGQSSGVPATLDRHYFDGGFTGDSIELSGIKGPYDIEST